MACTCAALLGLVNELMGGSLIAPAGQELRPSAAATQWADAGGKQEVTPQVWASLGVALTHQVISPNSAPTTALALHSRRSHSVFVTARTALLIHHAPFTD